MKYRDTDGQLKDAFAFKGQSAYDSARIGGYTKSEQEFYEDLGHLASRADLIETQTRLEQELNAVASTIVHKVERVRLETDGEYIYYGGVALTFEEVKEYVMDANKIVTLTLDNNVSFSPSAYDGGAIWFDSEFIEDDTANQLRVIINEENKVQVNQLELARKDQVYSKTEVIDMLDDMLKSIYPIGSIYINAMDANPSTILGFGVWQRVAKNRALWGANEDGEAGDLLEAGLPDITGKINNQYILAKKDGSDTIGAFNGIAYQGTANYGVNASSSDWGCGVSFKASSGETKTNGTVKNDVYGKSDTVQPSAQIFNIWQRVM